MPEVKANPKAETVQAQPEQAQIVLTPDALAMMMKQAVESAVSTAIAETRKPTEEQVAIKERKERERERLRRQRAESEETTRLRQSRCSHMRANNTSVVAWYTFDDGYTRGVCQRCDKRFNPYKEDGSPDPDYAQMIQKPTMSDGF